MPMSLPFTTRHSIDPTSTKTFNTSQLRDHYLVEDVFADNRITCVYTFHDRFIVGGAKPVTQSLTLETPDILKADFFLQRRELGIINVGGPGTVVADGEKFTLNNKDALYLGKGIKQVVFMPGEKNNQPLYYYNSAPAHQTYPAKKVTVEQAETVELGLLENSNQRTIRKLLVSSILETCQLQMGLTELKAGSIWNTMPPHTHDRRMEVYLYFNVPANQRVCHFMGEPAETRHIWVSNNQAVISPPWSIHSGAGTSNYSFIWSMAGENLDYSDMDTVQPTDLK
jgi:4-deoxy-L-threo-5-hexosulose-uronate ketol-isomerase